MHPLLEVIVHGATSSYVRDSSAMDKSASMSLSQLRKTITAASLGHDDCLEKSELQVHEHGRR